MPVEYGVYDDLDWVPAEGPESPHPPAVRLVQEYGEAPAADGNVVTYDCFPTGELLPGDPDEEPEGGAPEQALMVARGDEFQRPISAALVESIRREAELSAISERLHYIDISVRATLTEVGNLYIRNMLLEIIKKLFLVEDDMPIYRLRELAESVTYEELDNFPVPAEYWYPIRHVALYIADDESPLYDTSLYFAIFLTRAEHRGPRLRWSAAFALAYGRTIYDVTGARPEDMLE